MIDTRCVFSTTAETYHYMRVSTRPESTDSTSCKIRALSAAIAYLAWNCVLPELRIGEAEDMLTKKDLNG